MFCSGNRVKVVGVEVSVAFHDPLILSAQVPVARERSAVRRATVCSPAAAGDDSTR